MDIFLKILFLMEEKLELMGDIVLQIKEFILGIKKIDY
jgi:hypothetical protein